jgi:hypothetical protein
MGVTVTLVGDVPAVRSAMEAGLGRYPDDLGVIGDLHIEAIAHDDEPGDPAWPSVQAVDGPEELVVRCGSAVATLRYARPSSSASSSSSSSSSASATIDVPFSLLAVPDALRLFVESVFTASLVRAGRLFAVHSALVVHDGVGLLLRGPSGAGKSTLTYSCLRRGMGVCSDDWVYAPACSAPSRFAGYPWRMMMTEDAATRFAELTDAATVPHPAAEGRKVPVVPSLAQQVPVAIAHAVVLLDPSPVLSLQSVSVDEALERFWAVALPTEREHLSDDWARALMERPVFVLRRGTDPDAATQVLADLAASLR